MDFENPGSLKNKVRDLHEANRRFMKGAWSIEWYPPELERFQETVRGGSGDDCNLKGLK
jgi:hypothetical protein